MEPLLMVLGGLSIGGIWLFLLMESRRISPDKIPFMSRFFVEKDPYIRHAIGEGTIIKTPDGELKVNHIKISPYNSNFFKILAINEYNEKITLIASNDNLFFDVNLDNQKEALTNPIKAINIYCNVDKNHEEHIDFEKKPWTQMEALMNEKSLARLSTQEAYKRASSIIVSNEFDKEMIDKAEVTGIVTKTMTGEKREQSPFVPSRPSRPKTEDDEGVTDNE